MKRKATLFRLLSVTLALLIMLLAATSAVAAPQPDMGGGAAAVMRPESDNGSDTRLFESGNQAPLSYWESVQGGVNASQEGVLPDLSGYYMPPPLNPQGTLTRSIEGSGTLNLLDLSDLPINPVNGLPPDKLHNLQEGDIKENTNAIGSAGAETVGQTQQIIDIYASESNLVYMTVQLAAIGTNCKVYIKSGDPAYAQFAPSGASPNQNAQAIVNEFDGNIYPMLRDSIGTPKYLANTSQKVNIILYDIGGDGYENFSGSYTAGYFYTGDVRSISIGNKDTNMYVDIGLGQGYYLNFQYGDEGRASFYGTIVHELQHMINYTYFIDNMNSNKLQYIQNSSDPDWRSGFGTSVSTWYDEGLSGVVEALYLKSRGYTMDLSNLRYFLAKMNLPSSGYVPTRGEWSAAGGSLFHYGSVSAIMQEYYTSKNTVASLVSHPKTGYTYSLENVSEGYFNGPTSRFNEFFTGAMLNLQVDSPAGPQVRYYSNVLRNSDYGNTWKFRSSQGIGDTRIYPGSYASFNSGGRKYYTQTFVADAIGSSNGSISINIPSSGEYYIITPFGRTNVSTRASWDDVPKMAARLNSGDNTVMVGTNNMFAVLALAHNTSVSASFSYTARAVDRTAVTAFVNRLYTVCLDRPAEAAGLNYWVEALISGQETGMSAAANFFFLPEFVDGNHSDSTFVERLYLTLMGRASDGGGKAHWLAQLASGWTREAVFADFVYCEEFAQMCAAAGIETGSYTPPPAVALIRAFVERMYDMCLNRGSDTEGIEFWTQQLVSGAFSGTEVADGFFFSNEMNSRAASSEQFVTILYKALMDRSPEPGGLAFWVDRINSTGDRREAFYSFAGEPEFGDICARFRIRR